MVLLFAAALATASTPAQAPSISAQATATIRVIAAVRLRLDGSTNTGAPPVRNAVLRLADGTSRPARLIEFQ
jgi:hypothetical protein